MLDQPRLAEAPVALKEQLLLANRLAGAQPPLLSHHLILAVPWASTLKYVLALILKIVRPDQPLLAEAPAVPRVQPLLASRSAGAQHPLLYHHLTSATLPHHG
jgi:hypothetical protein